MAKALIVAVVAAAVAFQMAAAAVYNVGEPGGSWDLQTNYTNWVANKRFHPGDQLVFKYSPSAHDVLEVTKAAYDACSTDNEIKTYNSGSDTIPLTAAGTRYFLCGFPNHCAQGMKLQVDVSPSSFAAAPAGAPGANGAPNPASAAASVKAAAGAGLGALVLGFVAAAALY